MNTEDGLTAAFHRLLWPEHVAVSDRERALAADRIHDARVRGVITEEQAGRRRALLPAVRTRADLRAALDGLPGAVTPPALPVLAQVIGVVWLGASLVQFVVWTLLMVFGGGWDNPWWLWTAVVGGVAVAGLHWFLETQFRVRITATSNGSSRRDDRAHRNA